MKRNFASLALACVLALAGAAHAQQFASTTKSVHLRAGPGRDYPVVAILGPNTAVTVYGCVPQYTWCDVVAGADRGWVYAGNLSYLYQGNNVLLPGVAAVIGIGITAFILDDYWGHYYTDRPWWPERRRYQHPRPVPPPHVHSQPHLGAPGQPFGPPVGPPHVEPGPQDRLSQPPVTHGPPPAPARPAPRAVPQHQPHQPAPHAPPQRKQPPEQH